MNKELKFFIIDGMALIYRAHFAMIKNPLTTKNGQHTSAIYGFANSIFKLIKEHSSERKIENIEKYTDDGSDPVTIA